jgi:hypothetical protein
MLAPFLSLALLALDKSMAIPFPHDTELPLPSDTDTGTSNPMMPASKSTAPTAMINRRTVTVGLPSNASVVTA